MSILLAFDIFQGIVHPVCHMVFTLNSSYNIDSAANTAMISGMATRFWLKHYSNKVTVLVSNIKSDFTFENF